MKTKTEIKNLKELERLGGKFKCTHQSEHNGRKQTIVLIKVNSKYYKGNAQCNRKDIFSKKFGRAIALGRAMKACKENRSTDVKSIPEIFRFKEDVKNDTISTM